VKSLLCIDPGHGGRDSGATSLDKKLLEKDVALKIGLKTFALLDGVVPVMMTRRTDIFIGLSERAEIANKAGATHFLSIHCNSAKVPASGIEVFTSPGQTPSDPYATIYFNDMLEEFPDHKARKDLGDGDPDKEAKFTVLMKTEKIAILFETEFIHTQAGKAFFSAESNLDRIARSFAKSHLKAVGKEPGAVVIPVGPSPEAIAEARALALSITNLLA
jgi:N-acetylmuramoyl-L-alanine amidase